MSAETVKVVKIRAATDAAFRESLFADVESALAGYDLTEAEINDFKNMSHEDLDKSAKDAPEERKSMGIHIGNDPSSTRGPGTVRK